MNDEHISHMIVAATASCVSHMPVSCASHMSLNHAPDICQSHVSGRQSYFDYLPGFRRPGSHISITLRPVCPLFFWRGVGCVRVSQDCLLRHRHRHVIHKVHKNFQTCDVERHLQMIMVTKLNVWTDTAVDISCEVHVIPFRGGRLTSVTIHFRTRGVYLFIKVEVSHKVHKTATNQSHIVDHA